jgi:hypothetical protein
MKRTMIQRQVLALSEDLAEISLMLEEEEMEAQRVAKENVERHKKGEPVAGYPATPLDAIKQTLEFVEDRLASTIGFLGGAERRIKG